MGAILVVDDSTNIRAMVAAYLQGEGYPVLTAGNGREALDLARAEAPQLVILDIMMPQMDGLQFLEAFRRESQTPVILLTAKIEEGDKVQGLDLGADDYVMKPFGMRELMARVRAVLRRAEQRRPADEPLVAGDLRLDRAGHAAWLADRRIDLTPTESALLATLMAAPGQTLSRLELMKAVQGSTHDGLERTIDVHVRNLRAKLEPDPRAPRFVQTVYGAGYRFPDQESRA